MSDICTFSPEHYIYCMDLARKEYGFKIIRACDIVDYYRSEKVLINRHDVDFSLDYAVEMAELEHTNDIVSTYYLLTNTEHYNLLSKQSQRKINQIIELGHEIGWHVDTSNQDTKLELDMLNSVLGKENSIKSYAQHYYTTTSKPEVYDKSLVNVYDIPNVKYLSDSSMYWREGCICDNLPAYNRIQCLTHPVWWFTHSTNDRWLSIRRLRNKLYENQMSVLDEYVSLLERAICEELTKPKIIEGKTVLYTWNTPSLL